MKTSIYLFVSALIIISFISCNKEDEDIEMPVITLKGKTLDRVLAPKTYVDPGATAVDNMDGDITSKIVVTNSIDYTKPNVTYDLFYKVTDAAGNESAGNQRLVMLIDLTGHKGLTKVAGGQTINTWDTTTYTTSPSDSLKFKHFAAYNMAKVSSHMPSDSTLIIPTQTVMVRKEPTDTALIPMTFSGTGTLIYARSGPSIRTTININYTEVQNGVTTNGTLTLGN